jgi:GNAT superfamily N-acetyltransferase
VVGRIAAIHNRLHNEVHGDRVGFFGFFETVDDGLVARALFDAAAGWLGPRGLDTLRGPASFSVNDEFGLLVKGFAMPATIMNPYNPQHYVPLVEEAGFTGVMDLVQFQRECSVLPARLVRGAQAVAKRNGITVRSLDMRRFKEEVETIKRLYNAGWEKNWGHLPMTDHEIDHLAAQLRQIVVPELVLFAEHQGQTIGFAVALPDLNVALRANPSGRMFPGIVKVLLAARKVDRCRIALLGVVPSWQGKALDVILYERIWSNAKKRGIRWGEGGWVLQSNHTMANGLLRMGFEAYMTFRVYDRPI